MFWEAVKSKIIENNGEVMLNGPVFSINWHRNHIDSVTVQQDGQEKVVFGTDFISSMAVTEFIKKLNPPAPAEILEAVSKLSYRDFLTVCLIVDQTDLFEDNWIYIHDPCVKVGRIQNFKNWSPDMVPDSSKTSLGLEYFCNQGDELWNSPDDQLVELAKKEIDKIGLAHYKDIVDGCVFRVEKAYPVYDLNYAEHLKKIRKFTDSLENFQTVGRNGLHRYNNQDHAILTGLLAVRNALFDEKNDLWTVNAEQEYLEEISEEKVSAQDIEKAVESALGQVFMRL